MNTYGGIIIVCWLLSLLLVKFSLWGAVIAGALFCVGCLALKRIFNYHTHINQWQKIAHSDSLTNLLNRRGLESLTFTQPFCLIMIDIDGFKSINDCYGHTVGDQTLQWFANHLQKHTRKGDVCARWGGDEFIIILTNTDIHGAHVFLERLQHNNISEPKPPVAVCFSSGIVNSSSRNLQDLIQVADREMLQEKERKKSY